MLIELLKEKNMSIYQCSKLTGIPYTTLSELVNGKTNIENCSVSVVYKLSKVLGTAMENLIEYAIEERLDFEVFKSNMCHFAKKLGQYEFVKELLMTNQVGKYWSKKWYPEAFYTLAMLDYISMINDIPLCKDYEHIRKHSLEETIYPKGIELISELDPSSNIKEECLKQAIPEFLKYNIVESEIDDVF